MVNPNSWKNMIPLGRDPVHDAAVRAKIKGSSSQKRKLASRLRWIKYKMGKGIPQPDIENKLLEIVRDPEVSALKIEEVIVDMLENEQLTHRTKVELIGKMIQAHVAIHGVKTKNVNVNIDMTIDNIIERLRNAKKKEKVTEVKIEEEKQSEI